MKLFYLIPLYTQESMRYLININKPNGSSPFLLYTLDSPFYSLMTDSLDNSSVLLFLSCRYLKVLTPRFFQGTSYHRGLSTTHENLRVENNDRIIETVRFCSSSTERSVA
jgi:hypothetical protein